MPSLVFRDLISDDPDSLATVRYYGILIDDVRCCSLICRQTSSANTGPELTGDVLKLELGQRVIHAAQCHQLLMCT